jgi:hypothetical protein
MTISLEDIMAKLDPKTRARVQSAQNVKVHKQLTPSIGLNVALKGGLGYGRQVLVWEISLLVNLLFVIDDCGNTLNIHSSN